MHDMIIGLHSVAEALKNPRRKEKFLYGSEEGLKELEKLLEGSLNSLQSTYNVEVKMLSPHAVQEEAKKLFKEKSFQYSRISSNVFLLASALEEYDLTWLYDLIDNKEHVRLLALDGITDARNGAALLRTAAFYGVDAVLIAQKGSFGQSPGFFRIASGAREHLEFVRVAALPKTLKKLQERGVQCLGLSEHGEEALKTKTTEMPRSLCLVLGAEDKGLSHAVKRVLPQSIKLNPLGKIKSLNVAVAGAISMEKVFGETEYDSSKTS